MKQNEKKTIVILHGWASKIKRWKPLVKKLKKRKFAVFLPKLPGFNNSSLSSTWSLNNYCSWLKKYLENNFINNPILLGHSFGGRVAIKFCHLYPNRIEKLILVSSAGIKQKVTIKKIFFQSLAKTGKLFFLAPPFCFFRNFARLFLYRLTKEQDYYQANKILRQTMNCILAEDLTPLLSSLKAKTLLVWGNKDKTTPLANAFLMEKKIPKAKLVVFNNTKHNLPFTKTKDLIKLIVSF